MTSMIDRILIRRKDGQAGIKLTDRSSEKPFILSSLFYMSILLFVGVPMWFSTCSKTRYSLPNLNELKNNLNQSQLKLHLDISVVDMSRKAAKKIENEFSHFEDRQTTYLRTNLPNQIATSVEAVIYNINWRVRRPTHDEIKIFQDHSNKGSSTFNPENPATLQELEQNLLRVHPSTNRFRLFMYLIDESEHTSFCDPARPHTYTIGFERFIFICPSTALSSQNNYDPVINLINDAVQEIYQNTVDFKRLSHIMSNHIDLLHTLLPETLNQKQLLSLIELGKRIQHIFRMNVGDKFPELKELINIRLITQQLVDIVDDSFLEKAIRRPLASNQANNSESKSTSSQAGNVRTIKLDQIGNLFYRFESRLSKHSSQNVHNVLTLASNPDDLPLLFESNYSNGIATFLEGQDSNSLMIANDDRSTVLGLRAIVRRLIGLNDANLCNNCLVRRDIFFNKWELDAIMGSLIITKLKNTLISLQSISQQVIGIRIPKEVSAVANEAHLLASQAIEHLKTKRILESYRSASQAYDLSEMAFYDPSLLESLYFPDEFKYAIYLPLFLPLALPLLTSLVRIFKFFITSEDKKLKIN